MKRQELQIIEDELNDYDKLKENLIKIRSAYSNLADLEHKKADKLRGNSIFTQNHIDIGNKYREFSNVLVNLLNGNEIEDILNFINIPLKHLEKESD